MILTNASSIREGQETHLVLVKGPTEESFLYVYGEQLSGEGCRYRLTTETRFTLREVYPWISPRRIPLDRPSFGFGDQLGLATTWHIRALAGAKVFPILVQQSVRENARIFEEVLAKGIFGAFQEGYEDGFGADADHLKQIEDALYAVNLGYTFFTWDPGGHVVAVEDLSSQEVQDRFTRLPESETFRREYFGPFFKIDGLGSLRFSEEEFACTAVKYGEEVSFAARMYQSLGECLSRGFDYEGSLDETETPTTSLEHLFVAQELRRRGVDFVSLAPRFVGAMEPV